MGGFGLIGLVLAFSLFLSLASLSGCPGNHIIVTWFTADRTINFCIQSATSSDFVPLAATAETTAWLSVQIVICSFTNLFLRQLVTQTSIAATSAWKAVASCPSGWTIVFCFDICKFLPQSLADYRLHLWTRYCVFSDQAIFARFGFVRSHFDEKPHLQSRGNRSTFGVLSQSQTGVD